MIELGRYNQNTRDNRNCPFCGSNQIEDEIHFLFNCSKYTLIRNDFYNKIKILIPNITELPVSVLINKLMNSANNYINLQFMKYISARFNFRDELLSSLIGQWLNFRSYSQSIIINSFCNTKCTGHANKASCCRSTLPQRKNNGKA